MNLTNDQYCGLNKLEKWYHKASHQIIEISGVLGTGIWQLIQKFLEYTDLDMREVMYLSYDQKQVLELASKRYHAYYINRIIYNYNRVVDFNSLPVINSNSEELRYTWKKDIRKKIDPRYKLMIVFDSILLNQKTLRDLCTFGLPIILIRDPMQIPALDSYTFFRDPNIILNELHPDLIRNPIVYFANKVLHEEKLKYGNYDIVSIIPRKQMNLYNLKSADMVLTITDEMSRKINDIYREKIMKFRSIINWPNERVICMSDMYNHKLVNKDEKNIKIYLTKGMIGYINRCNRHAITTKYVPIEFRPEFYFESFDDLIMDRHYLNKINPPCRQIIPDEVIKLDYAYALSVSMARLSHWDKLTMILDPNEEYDEEMQKRMIYTGISKARKSMTIIF